MNREFITSLQNSANAGFFVTGSGTDVGKTYLLQRLLAHENQSVHFTAIKPLITGWTQDAQQWSQTDTGKLLLAEKRPLDMTQIDAISPWRYAAPVTPSMAQQIENRYFTLEEVVAFCENKLREAGHAHQKLLIEGVGGVMAPITATQTVLDWICALKLPVLLVVGTYLGALSHALTAVAVLRAHQVDIHAVIINETPHSTVSLADTHAALQGFLPNDCLIAQPYAFI